MFLGTVVNTLAVIAGSLIGIVFRSRFPKNIREIIFQGLGLCTVAIGLSMTLKAENVLILIMSVLAGGVTGEWLDIAGRLDRLGDALKKRLKSKNDRFTEGLVSAFLIFCIGSLTITGAIDAGVRGNHTILLAKSVLDGFAAVALAATYGSGVFFSAFALLIFQGLLTLFAVWFQKFFTLAMIHQLTATGGVLILGIGFNLLGIRAARIRTTNLLPALVYALVLTLLFR